ncbi:MAG TPA: hypothetical protein PK995_10310 [Bacteroidia bacterium]|nr:hypothetical protein [Bacteroidia bacterium]
MKIHHASSIRPIKNKLFTDEITIPVGLTPVSLIKSEFGSIDEKAENGFFCE